MPVPRRAIAARQVALTMAIAWAGAGRAASQESAPAALPPAPVSDVRVADHPWDDGKRLDVQWDLSPDDARVTAYQVLVAVGDVAGMPIEPQFTHASFVARGTSEATVSDLSHAVDKWDLRRQFGERIDAETLIAAHDGEFLLGYVVQVVAMGDDQSRSAPAVSSSPVQTAIQPFDSNRFWLLAIVLVVCGSVVTFIVMARRGMPLKIRKIAGLEAVDEAVGRATEMGRPVLFIAGTQDMNDIQTIAGLTVLSRVARTAAEYDARIEMPTSRSLVMTAARETVEASYLSAGRPDAFNADSIYYVTEEQFGFVAHIQGTMVRHTPAACFYMGHFFAESLILAETGNKIGAIQIAGTAAPAQLPFFVAACDYTLIGEEFFAASAYLSGEPDQLGSLKGQDVGKLIVAAFLVVGCVIVTLAAVTGDKAWQQTANYIRDTMLK